MGICVGLGTLVQEGVRSQLHVHRGTILGVIFSMDMGLFG